jgi:DNA-directed RNA polymerase subunit omega
LPDFSVAFVRGVFILARSIGTKRNDVNSELCRQALQKVGNPNVLINLISRRVRQLNSGGGSLSRPLIGDAGGLGAADIALKEIIDEKMGWEMPEDLQLLEPAPRKRKRG